LKEDEKTINQQDKVWVFLTFLWFLGAFLTNIYWAIGVGSFVWSHWVYRLHGFLFGKHELIEGVGWVDVVCPKTDQRYHYVICCPNTDYVVCKGCGKPV